MHNNTAFIGVQPFARLLVDSASKCQKSCMELHPKCTAGQHYLLHTVIVVELVGFQLFLNYHLYHSVLLIYLSMAISWSDIDFKEFFCFNTVTLIVILDNRQEAMYLKLSNSSKRIYFTVWCSIMITLLCSGVLLCIWRKSKPHLLLVWPK